MLGNLSDGTTLLDQIQHVAPELRGTTWHIGPSGSTCPRFNFPDCAMPGAHDTLRERQVGGSMRRSAAAFAPGLAGRHDTMHRDGTPFA